MSSFEQGNEPASFCPATDTELLSDARKGNAQAVDQLMTKYRGIVHKKANHYFLIGGDRDDVIQEGLIGLYKAICDYDAGKRASFKSFAELCITRQIISSIKSATRMKHTPLNAYVSIYKPAANDEHSDRMLLETIVDDKITEPLDWMETREHLSTIRAHLMKALTKLEWEVFNHYLQGQSYGEISKLIGRHEKSIDNALQRIKRKFGKLAKNERLSMVE